jgi:hypothetical protein
VTVGTMGNPKLGAEIAKDTKMRAEGGMNGNVHNGSGSAQ